MVMASTACGNAAMPEVNNVHAKEKSYKFSPDTLICKGMTQVVICKGKEINKIIRAERAGLNGL